MLFEKQSNLLFKNGSKQSKFDSDFFKQLVSIFEKSWQRILKKLAASPKI
jgi:hypothetical protein